MKKKELQEAKGKTREELVKLVLAKREQIPLLGLELKTGKHGNVRVVKNAKRELAQLKTLLRLRSGQVVLREKERMDK